MASKLLIIESYRAENPIEISVSRAFELLESKLRPPFSLEIPNAGEYVQLNRAIVYGVLTEPDFSKIHIKHLHAIVTDGYSLFVSLLVNIVREFYAKLLDSTKKQLFFVTREMIDVLGIGFDKLLVCLLRQIVGGDFTKGNLWLCFEIVSIFLDTWDCLLDEEPEVLTSGLYTFLRLLADHYRLSSNEEVETVKKLEIQFCVRMLREQFPLCVKIGRDLIRLLRDLAHVPEFEEIWKDLVMYQFSEITELYCLRTPGRYSLLRITPEMEAQLTFLLTNVKFGNQKRYQAWFAKKFLNSPEKETIIVDIVRFICCGHHPSNEIIQSNILPRWAAIGWLLTSCTNSYIDANVKVALFYDWLFYNSKADSIMNIEPAMLLMVYSIPNYINVTHKLLEFLFLLVDNFDVDRKDLIKSSVSMAFADIADKGVVSSLNTLVLCDSLSTVLKERLRTVFSFSEARGLKELRHHILPHQPVVTSDGLETPTVTTTGESSLTIPSSKSSVTSLVSMQKG